VEAQALGEIFRRIIFTTRVGFVRRWGLPPPGVHQPAVDQIVRGRPAEPIFGLLYINACVDIRYTEGSSAMTGCVE
jgi:hypothetical protein